MKSTAQINKNVACYCLNLSVCCSIRKQYGCQEQIKNIVHQYLLCLVNSISLNVTPNPAQTNLTPLTELVVRVSPDCL